MTEQALLQNTDELRSMLARGSASMPQFFKLRAALPVVGKTGTPMASTDRMWIVLKTYAAGGENELHAHPNEDHVFVVMQGLVEFYGPGGQARTIGKHECVLLPRDTYYSFKSVGDEPLVMLRVGSVVDPSQDALARIDTDGLPMDGFSERNKTVPAVLSDVFFE